MSEYLMTPEEALADAWASIDLPSEKWDEYVRERDAARAGTPIDMDDPTCTGRFEGYLEEAQEMIARLHVRGYTLAPLPAPPVPSDDGKVEWRPIGRWDSRHFQPRKRDAKKTLPGGSETPSMKPSIEKSSPDSPMLLQ